MSEPKTQASWCGIAALHAAARSCARHKRARPDALAFRLREGEELLALAGRLEAGSYRPEPGRVFVTERPKHREVQAAVYRDRVVHHLLHGLLEPALERRFSDASFACRKGKGTHAAALRLQQWMWRLSRHGGVRVFALQLDVVNFFMSLHRQTLLAMLEPVAREVEAGLGGRLPPGAFGPWELCRRIVLHDPGAGAHRLGSPALFARVPPHKRLGALGPDRGLPIGNLTSQLFGNVYLTPLDDFVQRTLGIRGYVRYVDDFVLLHPNAAVLEQARDRVVAFLRERLRLEVRAKVLAPVSEGVDFVGYVIRPRYLLPRRRVVRAFSDKLAALDARVTPVEVGPGVRLGMPGLRGVAGPVRVTRLDEASCEAARTLWASYGGHLGYAASWRLRQRLWREHPHSAKLLRRDAGGVGRRFAPVRPSASFRAQLARLARGITPEGSAKPAVLLVQVGSFAELPPGGGRFGLRRSRGGRRAFGLPWRFAARLIERILRAGRPVAVAIEEPQLCGNVKRRRLAYLYEPVQQRTGATKERSP